MPRWRALPEELDPEIREFAGQMRRLVDRSGLSIAAVADRTGYSKTSWERYLNGRLLPPQGAISALAEVTGTDVRHLATMWELAERAWSRAEMRHDMTMEAIRISQAREALGAFEPDAPAAKKKARGRDRTKPVNAATPLPPGPEETDSTTVLRRQSRAPAQPVAPRDRRYHAPQPPGPAGPATPPLQGGGGHPSGSRRAGMFLAGVVGALAVIGAAVFLFDLGGGEDQAAAEPTTAPTKPAPKLPAGVKCSGEDCAGEDPELMGCGGQYAETTSDAIFSGAYIEVRYSEVCKAAWARVTDAAPGATVRITADQKTEDSKVGEDTDGYTKMVAAKNAEAARVCLETAVGAEGCTTS
ncbi:helix-turn-helix domain-containing protein [Streptomyces gobiensis]|uniref:helix-turn-helix domain-containing protein n=1 Tax=Streptomyces gobiensis TaxID=2875706 RepID=UPI001E2E4007|nr:XRE family transcriptional regulator [Streptomyces gobiensis]UGY93226.1 DUF2690 domain-containing protein [Streptomyces gobiensis]